MNEIHSCGYYCDKPACIKAQRDELRDKQLKDVERMEFLENMKGLAILPSATQWTRPGGTKFMSKGVLSGGGVQYGPAPTLRETIDAAMKVEAGK